MAIQQSDLVKVRAFAESLSGNDRKNFIEKYSSLDSDEKRQTLISRLPQTTRTSSGLNDSLLSKVPSGQQVENNASDLIGGVRKKLVDDLITRRGKDDPLVQQPNITVNPLSPIVEGFKNVGKLAKREESAVTGGIRGFINDKGDLGEKFISGIKGFVSGARGDDIVELGDIFLEKGDSRTEAASKGLAFSLLLPSSLLSLKVGAGAKQVYTKMAKGAARVTGAVTGVGNETTREIMERGANKVLNPKFLSKQFPAEVQQRIQRNIDNLAESAGKKFEQAVAPENNKLINFSEVRKKIIRTLEEEATNRFGGPDATIASKMLDVFNNTRIRTVKGALKLRREMDKMLYTTAGLEKRNIDLGSKVRRILNEELHKNPVLKSADSEWYELSNQMREIGRKVTSDTGENYLKRFDKLTANQKKKLINLEKRVGGEPFVEDLDDFALAQRFAGQGDSRSAVALLQEVGRAGLEKALSFGASPAGRASASALDKTIQLSQIAGGRKILKELGDKDG